MAVRRHTANMGASRPDTAGPGWSFLRRVVAAVVVGGGIFALMLAAWRVRDAVLLVVASVVVAVILDAAAKPLREHTSLSRRWAVIAAGSAIGSLLALLGWLLGHQVQAQIGSLASLLPQAVQSMEQRVGLSFLADQAGQSASGWSRLVGEIAAVGTTILSAATSLILVVIAGFFLAINPATYRRGLVALFPKRRQQEVDTTLAACGEGLRLWLVAALISMSIVGCLTGLGAWLIGLPAPLALGVIAGLAEFIPTVGPILSAVPAVLLAFTQGTHMVVWTLVLYAAIQQLESNLITPLVQQRMVTIPPALLLFAAIALGLLFGSMGLILAAPLTVIGYIAVKRLYVRDALAEETNLPTE